MTEAEILRHMSAGHALYEVGVGPNRGRWKLEPRTAPFVSSETVRALRHHGFIEPPDGWSHTEGFYRIAPAGRALVERQAAEGAR